MKYTWLLLVGLPVALSISARAQQIDYSKVEITADKIAPNLFVLSGSPGLDPVHPDAAGGRVGVLAGPDGIFIVDAQHAELIDKVVAVIKRISSAPIRFLVNTHIHEDHTGANANFAKMGVTILAREELREGMVHPVRAANVTDPTRLPVVTYGLGGPVKLYMNDEIVDLIPVRAAHTNGD